MPLRDHFHPPLDDFTSWQGFHAQWPATIVATLNRTLPPEYVAEPRVHLGAAFEIDIAGFEVDESARTAAAVLDGASDEDVGGLATAVWAPPRPTLDVATDLPDQYVYEVRVYDAPHRQLVAAVEIVSPANKDRPEHRRAFVAKCAALLQQGVSVSIVDLITTRHANLYADLLDLIGRTDPSLAPEPPPIYAAACRWRRDDSPAATTPAARPAWRLQAWAHPLAVGRSLPTLPLWLADDLAVPLELDATYEETCRALRLPR